MNTGCNAPNDGRMIKDLCVRGARDQEHGKAHFASFILVLNIEGIGKDMDPSTFS